MEYVLLIIRTSVGTDGTVPSRESGHTNTRRSNLSAVRGTIGS